MKTAGNWFVTTINNINIATGECNNLHKRTLLKNGWIMLNEKIEINWKDRIRNIRREWDSPQLTIMFKY